MGEAFFDPVASMTVGNVKVAGSVAYGIPTTGSGKIKPPLFGGFIFTPVVGPAVVPI